MSKKLTVKVNGNSYEVEVGDVNVSPVSVSVNGKSYSVEFEDSTPSVAAVRSEPVAPVAKKSAPLPAAAPVAAASADTLTAPMPGTILDITVKPGDSVAVGQTICALEAMKMKNMIKSPRTGTVASVEVTAGQKVGFGAVIIRYA
ncbi:MAG: acetyl-CoA carboxylase biotin carboxyl carrier protein subunit [Anaerolineaceae bacterium]|nr:acetyl-CoA carboxylase biotin carboxyl carrier protein subunit [Anaerolineaceae bacterium]